MVKESDKRLFVYYQAFLKALNSCENFKEIEDIPLDKRKKLLFLAVRTITVSISSVSIPKDMRWEIAEYVREIIKTLTYNEFISVFPITKEYDGDRYGTKDYFSTMEYLVDKSLNEKIGKDVENFLWRYYNGSILSLNAAHMILVSDLYKEETGGDLFMEWLSASGKDIDSYIRIKNGKKQYLQNTRTGEITKAIVPLPSYLKIIK